jgi:hypothetical protein
MRKVHLCWITKLLVVIFVGCFLSSVAYGRLPVDLEVKILFKVLTYDSSIKIRSQGGIRIGIVGYKGNPESKKVLTSIENKVLDVVDSGLKIKGLEISAGSILIKKIKELEKEVEENDYNVLYLCPGLDRLLGEISFLAVNKKLVLLTGEGSYVRQGVSVGVVKKGRKPHILINLKAASAQGANFDARLLRLAEVVAE